MSIKTVQSYSIQNGGMRNPPPSEIFISSSLEWKRNPAWLPMKGFDYSYDTTFNTGTGANDTVNEIEITTDNKMYVGGQFTTWNGNSNNALVRLNANGTYDSTFNMGVGFNNIGQYVYAIKIQSDDKVIVGGNFDTFQSNTQNNIIRLNSDGSKDPSFNIGTGFNSSVHDIQIQSDGKILVGGYYTQYQGNSYNGIIRLNTDGSIDTSFVVGTGFNGLVNILAIQSDGKILVGGNFISYQGINYNQIIRLNIDGSIDTSFNVGTGFDNTGTIYDIKIQSDGKILVVGSFTSYQGNSYNGIIRLNTDGSIDTSFVVGTGFNNYAFVISIRSDGIIFVGGNFSTYKGTSCNKLIALRSDGSSYNVYNITSFVSSSFVAAIKIQTDLNLLIGGNFTDSSQVNISRRKFTEEKIVLLKAVYANSDFASFKCAGNYTVDWGDGNTTNYTSGTQANHQYDYANTNLDNTNGPVTFTDAGDLVTRIGHGYANNDIITFSSITSTTGISIDTPYYITNATANTFQLSETSNGSILPLTTDGTGTLLPYKQVLITITPQAGANLTQTLLDVFNPTVNKNRESGFLDIALSIPNVTSFSNLTLGSNLAYNSHYMLESINILNHGLNYFSYFFYGLKKLQFIALFDTKNFTSMNSLFYECSSLKTVPLFNTASVTDMSYMFYNCTSLQSVPLFNTANVTNMSYMFSGCYSLQSVPLFNTVKVTSMNVMFLYCYSLQSVPLFNTANVTDMYSMFLYCYSLKLVPQFNTVNVTDMNQMFFYCVSLKTVPLFNTTNVTNMSYMFYGCSSLESVPLFNTTNVTNMSQMFNGCLSLESVPLFNTVKVTDMSYMFYNCSSLQSVPQFNVINVYTMNQMFYNCSSLQSVYFLNTNSVTNMSGMFNNCFELKSVPSFNTANVTDMSQMFQSCYNLQSVPLFNTANVTSMGYMFEYCYNLQSVPLFNTVNVTSMGSMFNGCSSLKTVPLFNTANVATMYNMFSDCSSLQSLPLFNTVNVTSMGQMFYNCGSLKTVPQFNTANVINMAFMFNGCSSIQSVPILNTAKVTNMNNMFVNCYSLKSIPTFNTAKVTSMSQMFQSCYALKEIPSMNCFSVSASGFSSMFYSSHITRSQLINTKVSISYASQNLANTELNEIYTNLPTVTGQTITVTGNWGTATDDPTIATAKGWTVTG